MFEMPLVQARYRLLGVPCLRGGLPELSGGRAPPIPGDAIPGLRVDRSPGLTWSSSIAALLVLVA